MSGYGQTVFANGSAPPINAANLNKTEQGVGAALGYDSLQEIRDLGVPTNSVETVYARGHTFCSDSGAGVFHWLANSTLDDDDGIVLLPTGHSGPGRWGRALADFITPQMFGAKADAVWSGTDWVGTNDSPAIQAADIACGQFGLPLFGATGNYLVVESIKRSPGVTWVGQEAVWAGTADAPRGFNLCPSHTLTSERDSITGKWSNPVLEFDYDNTLNFFSNTEHDGINIIGAPSYENDFTYQCQRAAIGVQNQAEVNYRGMIRQMLTAYGTCGMIDSSFDGLITLCGDDHDTAPVYALDLRTDLRVENGDPGYGEGEWEIRGTNALKFTGRMIYCRLWFDIYSFNGSGGISFTKMKFEETVKETGGLPDGRKRAAGHIRARTGDVYFDGGTNFRSFEDTRWLVQVDNAKTEFSDVGFLSSGRFVQVVGSGCSINGFVTQNCRCDTAIFSLRDDCVMTNGRIEQNVEAATSREFATITGNNVYTAGLQFTGRGTPGVMTVGPLFRINAGLTGIDINYSMDDEANNGKTATLSGGTGSYAKEFREIKVERQGASEKTWTDYDWSVDGELYLGGVTTIQQRERCYKSHLFDALTTPMILTKIIQGYLNEVLTIGITDTSVESVTIKHNDFIILTGGVDVVLGTDANFLCFQCVDGDIWLETARG